MFNVTIDEVCTTSVKLSLNIYTDSSTCPIASFDLHLVEHGKRISPHSRNSSHYQFNGLEANTEHHIQFFYDNGVHITQMHVGDVYTLASLRKFSKYLQSY